MKNIILMSFDISLNSLDICVKDMKRAIHFYQRFFERPVSVKDEVFSIFDIKGFRFCLFNNQKMNENVTWGDNCLPSFEVSDMDRMVEKLKALGADIT